MSPVVCAIARVPATARMPGRTTPGRVEAVGQPQAGGELGRQGSRRRGPAAAITTFEPWFNPWPE